MSAGQLQLCQLCGWGYLASLSLFILFLSRAMNRNCPWRAALKELRTPSWHSNMILAIVDELTLPVDFTLQPVTSIHAGIHPLVSRYDCRQNMSEDMGGQILSKIFPEFFDLRVVHPRITMENWVSSKKPSHQIYRSALR